MARPRKHDYDNTTARYNASRAALRDAGGAILQVALQPDTKATLDALVAASGEKAVEIINRLIREAGQNKQD